MLPMLLVADSMLLLVKRDPSESKLVNLGEVGFILRLKRKCNVEAPVAVHDSFSHSTPLFSFSRPLRPANPPKNDSNP